jgi:hypothetical protein
MYLLFTCMCLFDCVSWSVWNGIWCKNVWENCAKSLHMIHQLEKYVSTCIHISFTQDEIIWDRRITQYSLYDYNVKIIQTLWMLLYICKLERQSDLHDQSNVPRRKFQSSEKHVCCLFRLPRVQILALRLTVLTSVFKAQWLLVHHLCNKQHERQGTYIVSLKRISQPSLPCKSDNYNIKITYKWHHKLYGVSLWKMPNKKVFLFMFTSFYIIEIF